jgi:hypothetical protein
VSVTIGGNDIGFANILSDCTASALTDGCSAGIRTTTATALGALGAKLVTTVAAIKDTYPGATVLVTGYPVMFGDNPPTRCTVGNYKGFYPLWINKTDAIWLNEVAVELNGVIKDAAGRSGATYVDVQKTFDTHGRCDTSTAWVNGVILKSLVPTVASEASFHPTATGQSGGYAAAFPTPLP